MKVRIRHVDSDHDHDCGDMNPDQLHTFLRDLQLNGVYDGENLYLPVDAALQFVQTGRAFYADVFWAEA